MIIDINAFCGHWPFRKIYTESMDKIVESAKKNNIDSMIISSLNSIFYQDPYEGDEEIAAEIPKGSYQALTINPAQEFFEDDIKLGMENMNIKAVRIHPEYHNYSLTDNCVSRLFDVLYEYNLPLMITGMMEDPRMMHFKAQNVIHAHDIGSMISRNKKIPVIITHYLSGNWGSLKGVVEEFGNLNFDTSGIKFGHLDIIESTLNSTGIPATNLLYGSHYPLNCRESILNYFTMDEVPEEHKKLILCDNAKRIFNI